MQTTGDTIRTWGRPRFRTSLPTMKRLTVKLYPQTKSYELQTWLASHRKVVPTSHVYFFSISVEALQPHALFCVIQFRIHRVKISQLIT